MIVSTCSYGSTGSSAVSDYLKECDGTQVLDKLEFTIPTGVDGLTDLEYHLVKKNTRETSSIYAIQRFQKAVDRKKRTWSRNYGIPVAKIDRYTNEFLDAITQVKYVGVSPRIYRAGNETVNQLVGNSLVMVRLLRPLERKGILKKNVDVYPFETVRMSIHPDNFYEEARRYMRRLLSGMGADLKNRIVVLDQAFSGSDPTGGFPFFDDPYSIIVDRDPRDIYIFAKEVLLSKGRFMPSGNAADFIRYYRAVRSGREEYVGNSRCLYLRFEDLVYDYDNAVRKIDDFLHVTNNRKKTIFDPSMSVANTNLIRKFPQYADDVREIERELPEFLFDFDRFPDVANDGKMFYGKSPKNK